MIGDLKRRVRALESRVRDLELHLDRSEKASKECADDLEKFLAERRGVKERDEPRFHEAIATDSIGIGRVPRGE